MCYQTIDPRLRDLATANFDKLLCVSEECVQFEYSLPELLEVCNPPFVPDADQASTYVLVF